MIRLTAFLVCVLLLPAVQAASPPAAADRSTPPATSMEVWLDPPADGKQVVTIRLMPTATLNVERLEAECRYRQEFPWPPRAANPGRRVIEPAVFTYKSRAARFVNDLAWHLSFFVPVDVRELRDKHGPTTFVPNASVTLSSVTLAAFDGDRKLWSIQARPATNVHDGVLR